MRPKSLLVVFLVIALVFDIAGSIIAMSTTGSSGPNIQSGSVACTVPINGNQCATASVPFSPAYSNTPVIGQVSLSFNPAVPMVHGTVPSTQSNNLITFQSPGNSTLLFYHDETPVTANIPAVDTQLKSFSLGGFQPWPNVIVEGEAYITTSALSTKQVVSIMVEDCFTLAVWQTISFETESLAVGKSPFSIKGVVPNNNAGQASGCWSINVKAPAADANTQITLVSLRLYGMEEGFRTWLNMPSSLTEIYGSSSDEQQFSFSGTSSFVSFCVYVQSISVGSAYLTPFVNGVELNSGLELFLSPGRICSSVSVSLPTGSFIVTVMGSGGAGALDSPAFGAITLSWTQSTGTVFVSVPAPYKIQIVSLTTSSFKLNINFYSGGGLLSAETVTFSWQSIGS